MAEAFVRTFKRDYVSSGIPSPMPKPSCSPCRNGSTTTTSFTRTGRSDIVHPASSSRPMQHREKCPGFWGLQHILPNIFINEQICYYRATNQGVIKPASRNCLCVKFDCMLVGGCATSNFTCKWIAIVMRACPDRDGSGSSSELISPL